MHACQACGATHEAATAVRAVSATLADVNAVATAIAATMHAEVTPFLRVMASNDDALLAAIGVFGVESY